VSLRLSSGIPCESSSTNPVAFASEAQIVELPGRRGNGNRSDGPFSRPAVALHDRPTALLRDVGRLG
jgi:hypothetical protein